MLALLYRTESRLDCVFQAGGLKRLDATKKHDIEVATQPKDEKKKGGRQWNNMGRNKNKELDN